jgi:hypothetical protein
MVGAEVDASTNFGPKFRVRRSRLERVGGRLRQLRKLLPNARALFSLAGRAEPNLRTPLPSQSHQLIAWAVKVSSGPQLALKKDSSYWPRMALHLRTLNGCAG